MLWLSFCLFIFICLFLIEVKGCVIKNRKFEREKIYKWLDPLPVLYPELLNHLNLALISYLRLFFIQLMIIFVQVQVTAENRFGTSDPSAMFRFHTSTVGKQIILYRTQTYPREKIVYNRSTFSRAFCVLR